LVALSGKPFGTELTYDEYAAALAPFCTTAGKYPTRTSDALVHEGTVWRDVFALDLSRIDKSHAAEQVVPAPRPAPPAEKHEARFGERQCPNCEKNIDIRATFCTHCRQKVADLAQCPHCQEARVPSDLEVCWQCGSKMRQEEQFECQRCFTWKGYKEQFPCAHCGFSFDEQGAAAPAAVGPATIPIAAKEQNVAETRPVAVEAPAPTPVLQCRICYSMVEAGPRCTVCASALEIA
jgi:hypothetical protein